MKNRNYIIVGALGLVLVLIGWLIINQNKDDKNQTKTSANYPINFPMMDPAGRDLNLKEYQGKTIVLNFWASWCKPCIYEMPAIQKYYDQVDNNEVKVVLVALDQNFEKSKAFMNNNDYSLPYYKPKSGIPSNFNVSAIPTTYIINGKGKVVSTYTGMTDFSSQDFKQTVRQAN